MPVVQSRHGRTMHKRNAQLGLKTLLSSGIEVIAMLQESWTKLAELNYQNTKTAHEKS